MNNKHSKNDFFSSIETLKGVGPKNSKLLQKLCGARIIDLLLTIPRQYKKRKYIFKISNEYKNQDVALKAIVKQHLPQFNPKMPYRILCSSNEQNFELIYFRGYKKYLTKILPVGQKKIICGKLEQFNNKFQIIHPETISEIEDLPYLHGQLAMYSLTRGLNMTFYRKIIKQSIDYLCDMPEWIEKKILNEYEWKSWKESVSLIHKPGTIKEKYIIKFRERLAFDEALSHQVKLQILKQKMKKCTCFKIESCKETKKKIISNLNFELTISQKKVLKEIEEDLNKNNPMLRLLQGDVGSGKTIVAFISILNAVKKKLQVAFMVPTEILAIQHYNYFKELLKNNDIKIGLLTSKIKNKKIIQQGISSGAIQIIIGTHAVFQKKINYKNLAYIIIDEQHRFGVHQKFELASKGKTPHILAMTATPIPRTLALTMYGGMNISKITELPSNRKTIKTISLSSNRISKILDGLKNIIKKNYNAFWICPLIEESEELDLTAAQKRFEYLKKIFNKKVGLIHGKMNIEEKKDIIEKFKKKQIQILVSTTIIEVGIDIPAATVMIIEESNRFGLSQLHQLRGRVGRSGIQSTCILLFKKNINELGKKKIEILKKNTDGFFIAEEDLKLRGFGEIMGTKQTGYQLFKILNPFTDSKIMEIALNEAKKILKNKKKISEQKRNSIRKLLKIQNTASSFKYISAG